MSLYKIVNIKILDVLKIIIVTDAYWGVDMK